MAAGQYVARNVDNTPKVPQPHDVEITDAFGNIFDNFNQYGTSAREVRFYTAENTLKNPQPAYQNGNYVQRGVDNQPVTPPFEPDAAQWIARGVDNVERTPQKYEKSPLWPDGPPDWYGTSTAISVPIEVEQGEAYIVDEADVKTIMTAGLQGNEEEPL